jgi:glycyl-tRNA synthetase
LRKVREAVDSKIINNEILAFFIVRTYEFLIEIGIDRDNIRFRQHL